VQKKADAIKGSIQRMLDRTLAKRKNVWV